jgi:hypothetical protein
MASFVSADGLNDNKQRNGVTHMYATGESKPGQEKGVNGNEYLALRTGLFTLFPVVDRLVSQTNPLEFSSSNSLFKMQEGCPFRNKVHTAAFPILCATEASGSVRNLDDSKMRCSQI